MSGVVTQASELTAAWVSSALGVPVREVRAEPVGTGQIGTVLRLHLDADPTTAPATVLAKLPATDPAARAMMAGVYRTEGRFYADLAPTLTVRAPRCLYVAVADDAASTGDVVLLLEDLAPRQQGDQLAGCTPEQARVAALNLAGLHGPRWCDPTLLDVEGLTLNGPDDAALLADLFAPAVDLFLESLGGELALVTDEDAATLRACVPVIEEWALRHRERFAPVHGDYRLDNLMLPPEAGPGSELDVVAVDWQTLSLALPARDLAYLLGTGLEPGLRRTHERVLVEAYHRALLAHPRPAADGYDLETCWADYRLAMLQGPLVTVFGCAYGTRTERGDAMFAVMLARSCAAIRELGSLDLLAAD
ncbi:phosphotransferase family protein [Nocardioides nanhaiensis]|uniref:Phosphotransferase n=1 Tax=Nocardioides nanhaiensis TaxID=1476871 RepID=A0ABP8WCD6_9ACTN